MSRHTPNYTDNDGTRPLFFHRRQVHARRALPSLLLVLAGALLFMLATSGQNPEPFYRLIGMIGRTLFPQ